MTTQKLFATRNKELFERLEARLNAAQPVLSKRHDRYRGKVERLYSADEISGDLSHLTVNLCRVAVDAVAERLRVRGVRATARGRDVSELAASLWESVDADQWLQSLAVDVLALGTAYVSVWTRAGVPTITPESAMQVVTENDPLTGWPLAALKKWDTRGPAGNIEEEAATLYTTQAVHLYCRAAGNNWKLLETREHALGCVPVIPVINRTHLGDTRGTSVLDDMGPLVDALSKIMIDMLTASEDVARPRRWATGVDLEERGDDGFTADGPALEDDRPEVVSPFEAGNRMFTVESPEAKFGQLPGADLAGYRTAVELLCSQIMAISGLPAHMMGITTSNPSSADAIRAAEAGLTARAEGRIKIIGRALESVLKIALSMATSVPHNEITVKFEWASPATRSTAQEADAITKLHSLGIVTTNEARAQIGVDTL